MQVRREVQTDETLPLAQALPLAAQHLMAMFGATVLVPILTGLDVMAVTRVYAVQVFWYAGALAFLIGGFVPKVGALIMRARNVRR